MADLKDGESVEIKGSAAKPYVIKNTGGVYSCSCPAWRNQSIGIERRTCKHLRNLRGEAEAQARIGSELPAKPLKDSAEEGAGGPPLLLAHSWDNAMDLADWWMSEKLDGVRAYWDGNRFLSRQGNEFFAPDWFVAGLPSTPLDGELWIDRKSFQRTVSIVRRQDKSDHWREVRYIVFDAPAFKGVFEERLAYLKDTLRPKQQAFAAIHEHQRCTGISHLKEELARIESLQGEGLMLREPGSAYEAGRSSTLLKVKTFHDAEAFVIAHQPGKGKHKGRLGAVVAQLPDGTEFSIGTGFSDSQRESPPAIGSTVTFRYQELSDGGVPRFPSFVRVFNAKSFPANPRSEKSTANPDKVATKKAAVDDGVNRLVSLRNKADALKPRYFEFVEGTSSKFWEVTVDRSNVTVRYGRIGSSGTTTVTEFADEQAAQAQAESLIQEKTRKGYCEK